MVCSIAISLRMAVRRAMANLALCSIRSEWDIWHTVWAGSSHIFEVFPLPQCGPPLRNSADHYPNAGSEVAPCDTGQHPAPRCLTRECIYCHKRSPDTMVSSSVVSHPSLRLIFQVEPSISVHSIRLATEKIILHLVCGVSKAKRYWKGIDLALVCL